MDVVALKYGDFAPMERVDVNKFKWERGMEARKP